MSETGQHLEKLHLLIEGLPIPGERNAARELLYALETRLGETTPKPIAMRLPCEHCGTLHIDKGKFATHPHHTHTCQHCGLTWRPAKEHTVGVQWIPGFKDEGAARNVTLLEAIERFPSSWGAGLGEQRYSGPKSEGLASQGSERAWSGVPTRDGAQAHVKPGTYRITAEVTSVVSGNDKISVSVKPRPHTWKPGDWARYTEGNGDTRPFRVKEINGIWVIPEGDRRLIDPKVLTPWIPRAEERVIRLSDRVTGSVEGLGNHISGALGCYFRADRLPSNSRWCLASNLEPYLGAL